MVGCLAVLACPLVAGVQDLSMLQDLKEVGSGHLVVCSRLLPALLRFPWCIACKYALISHFKGVFRGFYVFCVCLYGLRSLCGLWGFCTRVELGGYMTCGVFAFRFPLLCPLSCHLSCPFVSVFASFYARCPSLLWLSFFCPLALSLCFLFPLRTIRKKKGRSVLVRPLFVCCGLYLSPFRLLGYFRNYKTIRCSFNPERVPCYPRNCK